MFLFSPIFWLFVLVPTAEIALFLIVGSRIGFLATIATIVMTAVVGTTLVQREGLSTMRRAQHSVEQGIPPTRELVDGLFILVSGLLLVTPGFFTDAVGFVLLLPLTRAPIRELVIASLRARATVQRHRQPRASEMEIIDESDAPERDTEDAP